VKVCVFPIESVSPALWRVVAALMGVPAHDRSRGASPSAMSVPIWRRSILACLEQPTNGAKPREFNFAWERITPPLLWCFTSQNDITSPYLALIRIPNARGAAPVSKACSNYQPESNLPELTLIITSLGQIPTTVATADRICDAKRLCSWTSIIAAGWQ